LSFTSLERKQQLVMLCAQLSHTFDVQSAVTSLSES
jgi:hypothetical protein